MWSPANKYAIPTTEDRFNANEAIKILKTEIVDAEEQIAHTRLRLIDMRKELQEREAWLAPIRKLSHDELSIIFNMCAEDDWMAPIDLAAVCQIWRHVTLATHRAWTFIDLKDDCALQLLPLYLQHSGQRTFHVGFDEHFGVDFYATVMQMADRIACLTIPELPSHLDSVVFRALTRLVLLSETRSSLLLKLKHSQFPVLRYLDLFYDFRLPLQIPDGIAESVPIQTLDIHGHGCGEVDTFHIVQQFGLYLKDLKVTIDDGDISNGFSIHLPQLEDLLLRDLRTWGSPAMPTIVAPRLKTFLWQTGCSTQPFPLDMDFGLLSHVRVSGKQKPPLPALRGLKVLQLYNYSSSYGELLQPLLHDRSICSNLEIVEICDPKYEGVDHSNVGEIILQINESRSGGDIKIFFPREDQLRPYSYYHYPVSSVCAL